MSILMLVLATALTLIILRWWLRGMCAATGGNVLLKRQAKEIRELRAEIARLRKLLNPDEDS
ncbi:MAG TPA: hypothetical protein VFU43_04050 [Streptosporangiaceae bacterium]|nr:hypothetical protein [Streptosporangiaceae bacterium]